MLVSSVVFVFAAWKLGPLCFVLSPVALAIVFWYSLAKRFTSYTQLFLGLAMAVAPVGGWLAAGGRGGWEPWLLGLAIGTWVGGFDVLYACQDLEFDRAHGLRSIPVRFGVARSLADLARDARPDVVCLAALAAVADLGPVYLAGVAGVAVLLVYEQSLVSEHDLSQVKKAFDLNGYVGILYLVSTAAAIYVRIGAVSKLDRRRDHRRERRPLRHADDGGVDGARLPSRAGDLGLRAPAAARRARRDRVGRQADRLPRRQVRRGGAERHVTRCTATRTSAPRSRAAARTARHGGGARAR